MPDANRAIPPYRCIGIEVPVSGVAVARLSGCPPIANTPGAGRVRICGDEYFFRTDFSGGAAGGAD